MFNHNGFTLFVQESFACQCTSRPSVYEAFDEAKAVFIGEVLTKDNVKIEGDYQRLQKVKVINGLKGVKDKEVIINSGSSKICVH